MAPQQRIEAVLDKEGTTPVLPLLQAAQHLLKPNGSIVGRDVADTIRPLFRTFCSAIPTFYEEAKTKPALASIDGRSPISHSRIQEFIVNEYGPTLHALGFGRGHRIALVLPNGPELALAIVATAQYASCVPLSANGAASELKADLLRAGVDLVVGPYSGRIHNDFIQNSQATDERFHVMPWTETDWSMFAEIEQTATGLGIPFAGLVPSPYESGIFKIVTNAATDTLRFSDRHEIICPINRSTKAFLTKENTLNDEVLVLFTSGTTGNKKLVPHQLGDILTAATTIALSWALTPDDVNCNLMPLFHVGGIVRQVFSPLVSGGCVICCPSFDPSIFWLLHVTKQAFTWYYAAPTMHQLILQTGQADGFLVEGKHCPPLRMIANAAGGLLPSLALQLRDTFVGATVLPSYGMTECMPISSPPATYQLEKPGTSGVAVGPEIAILNTTTMKSLPIGEDGPICVRGDPCFRGYGRIANDFSEAVNDTFMADGWFNTGDLGHLDKDGYLFITGRSKEVINRGGEIISPMEVEEAVLSHSDISLAAAFSAPHDVLQEVVGIVVVMMADRPRLDLASLHEFLGERLAAPKWPQCLIFMDGLPKSHTNKLLRVKLGSRLGLPELRDDMLAIDRTWEGKCPPQGTPLDVAIPVFPVSVSAEEIEEKLASMLVTTKNQNLRVIPHSTRTGSLVCYVYNLDRMNAILLARKALPRYAVPSHFVSLDTIELLSGKVLPSPSMKDAVASLLQRSSSANTIDPVVDNLQSLFAELLSLDYLPGPEANFFHIGGSSMLASQLASKLRKQFGIACSGAEIFHNTNCNDLAKLIYQRSDDFATISPIDSKLNDQSGPSGRVVDDHGAPFPSKRLAMDGSFLRSLFQLVPILIIFPIWQISRYILFFCFLLWSIDVVPGTRDIGTFIAAYLAFHLCWITITPLVFVAIKWSVIGRYKAGRYPIWGSYYLRWWFVDICRKLFLRGIWGSNEVYLNIYYRLLGAKIGKGARISLEADVAEFDLVNVGENAAVEDCTLRAFGVDNGAMILGPVHVGNNGSVGAKSVVAPFTSVPDDGHLGPVTSSYEVGKALDLKNRQFNRRCLAEPSIWLQVCLGSPITFAVNCFAQIPSLLILIWMLRYKGQRGEEFLTLNDLMEWLCDPKRIPFYIGIRVARNIVSPFFYMAAAIVAKKTVIGKFKAGPRDTWSSWSLFRHWLAATLFSRKKIQAVTDLIGRHYELVSVLYRLLGAKVGKRVFWPGSQPVFTGEFDLLEIGDDVVFGSRSGIFMTTDTSCEKVVLCAGANVADNCVVLPGSVVGKNAVLGSNSVCPLGWYLPEGSVWFGSKGCEPDCLDKGVVTNFDGPILVTDIDVKTVPMVGDATTLRPFGKAFYRGEASYSVWPLHVIIAATLLIRSILSVFHTLPLLGAIQGGGAILYGLPLIDRVYDSHEYNFFHVYFAILFVFFFTHALRVALWLVIELTAKWTLMGRREEGRYNYDTSSYAQRWELYQLISKVRKFNRLNFLDFLSGTPFMAAYFRLNGGRIGRDCCLFPAGADPFMPEPDLVTMGDRCVVDCASIVCHLNTRGNFELARITLENECTLRTRSRLQQGCYMEHGSQLLEKSLAMTGEVIEANSVWQGGPASWWFQYSQRSLYMADEEETADEKTNLLKAKVSSYNVQL